MKIEPFLLSSSLSTIEAQRLVRRICPYCKEKIELPEDMMNGVKAELADVSPEWWPKEAPRENISFFRGKGCVRCGGVGYKGRLVIDEVFAIDEVMQDLIVNGFPPEKVKAQAKSQGMLRIRQDGYLKAIRGLTTVEEVLRATQD